MVAPTISSTTKSSLGTRRKGDVPADPPTNYYLLLLVKICLVVIILLWLAPLVTGHNTAAVASSSSTTTSSARTPRSRRRRELHNGVRHRRLACQNEGVCALLVPEESLNCVNRCLSPDCYAKLWAHDPLEDGEIDVVRGQQFDDCLQEELRILRKETA